MPKTKTAVIFIADGTEELEFVATLNVLRRANVDVTIAGVPDCEPKTCMFGVVIFPEKEISVVVNEEYDAVIIPGGTQGVVTMVKSEEVKQMVQAQEKRNALIAAVCAGPLILKEAGVGLNKRITSYPKEKNLLTSHYEYLEDDVVVDDQLITSRGPGTIIDFGLEIAEHLMGKDVRSEICKAMVYQDKKLSF